MTMGEGHLISENFFKAIKVSVWKKEIAVMEKEKEERVSKEKVEREAHVILFQAKGPTTYLSTKLLVLMKWCQVPLNEVSGKNSCLACWMEILETRLDPPAFLNWTD